MLVELQRTIVEVSATFPLLVRLLCASIELAVLGVAMALLAHCLRDRWPRVVHWLWLVVLAKPLVSLTLGSRLPVALLENPAPELGNAQQVPVERSAATVVAGDAGANIFDNLAGCADAASRGIEAWPNQSNPMTHVIAAAGDDEASRA